MSSYFLHHIDILNKECNDIESFLSSADTQLDVDKPDAAWYARLGEASCKRVFLDARFITEETVSLRKAAQNISGLGAETLLSKPGVHRGRMILLSCITLACFWRPLKAGELRYDVVAKCRKLISNQTVYGSCEPHLAVHAALARAVVCLAPAPQSKRVVVAPLVQPAAAAASALAIKP